MVKLFASILIWLSVIQQVVLNNYDQCGETIRSTALVFRGNKTERGEFPFLCALYNIESNSIFCGGSIITSKHVLTGRKSCWNKHRLICVRMWFSAAHCLRQKYSYEAMSETDLLVQLGRYNLKAVFERGSLLEQVSHLDIHPQWKSSTDNYDADVAILTLAREITFTMFIRTICFPSENDVEFLASGITGTIVSENSRDISSSKCCFIDLFHNRLDGGSQRTPM